MRDVTAVRKALIGAVVSAAAVAAASLGLPAQQTRAASAATVDTSRVLPIDPKVTVGTLPNGIRYYIRVNQKPEKRAELRLVVNAGSVLEDQDQRGLAHFVE